MLIISKAQESYSPSMFQPRHFDSLAFAKKLKAAGVPDLQAEANAEGLYKSLRLTLLLKLILPKLKRKSTL